MCATSPGGRGGILPGTPRPARGRPAGGPATRRAWPVVTDAHTLANGCGSRKALRWRTTVNVGKPPQPRPEEEGDPMPAENTPPGAGPEHDAAGTGPGLPSDPDHAIPAPALIIDDESDVTEAVVTRVYLALLQQTQPSRPLLVAQGLPGTVVDRTLAILDARGLIRAREGGWEVLPPDIALPALAAELERRARAARGAAHELSQVFFQARAETRTPTDGLRILTSLEDLHSASAEIVSGAQTSVRAMRDRSRRTETLFAASLRAHRERSYAADGTELVMRTTYEVAVLEIEGAGEVLQARAEGGEQFRFVQELPFSVLVVDETAALVDVSRHAPDGGGSLLVRQPALVRSLAE